MANTIQVKRGAYSALPTLAAGEFGFSTDTKQVHIGDGSVNYEVLMHGLYGAQAVLASVSAGTPVSVGIAEQTVVGRITSGNIKALSVAEILTLIGVVSGADVTGSNPPQAHKDLHDPSDGSDPLDTAVAIDIPGVQAAGVGTSHSLARADHVHQIQHGIGDNHLVTIDQADIASDDWAKFTANGLSGRSSSQLIDDCGLATEAYVDAVATGLDLKASCRAATAAVLPACTPSGTGVGKTLTGNAVGVLTVDGVDTVLDDRILVKNQVAVDDNGIYKVTTEGTVGVEFVLTRATDFDADAEVTSGAFTFIEQGTTNANEGWVLTTNNVITVDTTELVFTQFSSAAAPITTFVGLSDTPANYTSAGLKVARVNTGADAIEFVEFAATYLEASPTEDLATKAPTSEWAFDHAAATTGVHGAGGSTLLHSGSTIDGGAYA